MTEICSLCKEELKYHSAFFELVCKNKHMRKDYIKEIKRLKKIIGEAWRCLLSEHIVYKEPRKLIGKAILILEKNNDESRD